MVPLMRLYGGGSMGPIPSMWESRWWRSTQRSSSRSMSARFCDSLSLWNVGATDAMLADMFLLEGGVVVISGCGLVSK